MLIHATNCINLRNIILSERSQSVIEIIYYTRALAGVAQWIECQPENQKVVSSISGQGTCLGCWLGPQLGASERQQIHVALMHQCFSLSLSKKRKEKKPYIVFI